MGILLDLKALMNKILSCLWIPINTNGWKGRKYLDGTFDIWREYTGSPAGGKHYTTVNGFYGYYDTEFYFPTNCRPITKNYYLRVTWQIGSGFSIDCSGYNRLLNKFNIYALSTAANISTYSANIYIHGKWK